jgi:hypothetical protein
MNETPEPASSHRRGGEPGPAQLLDQIRLIRERTSAAAHAYWLPLLLFGLVICGSLPFYQRLALVHASPPPSRLPSACVPGEPCHVPAGGHDRVVVSALGWYWQIAVPVAVALGVLWYRWRANRTGLRTPARGFLLTGLVLGELVLLISLLVATQTPGVRNDILSDSHHVGGLLVIAAILWVLAWAERSRALAAITAVFIVVALPVAVVTGGGIGGGSTGAADISLAAMRLLGLIPALVLLVSGAAAWAVQHSRLRA